MAYMHGNLAVQERQKAKPTVKIRETTKTVYKTKTLPIKEKLLYLSGLALSVALLGFVVWQYAQIYRVNTDIVKTKSEIRIAQEELSINKMRYAEATTPEALQKWLTQNGFKPATESQYATGTKATTTSKTTAATKDKKAAAR